MYHRINDRWRSSSIVESLSFGHLVLYENAVPVFVLFLNGIEIFDSQLFFFPAKTFEKYSLDANELFVACFFEILFLCDCLYKLVCISYL